MESVLECGMRDVLVKHDSYFHYSSRLELDSVINTCNDIVKTMGEFDEDNHRFIDRFAEDRRRPQKVALTETE